MTVDTVVEVDHPSDISKSYEIDDAELAELMMPLTVEEAQAVTGRIRGSLDDITDELVTAWHGRIWEAMGYANWDAWIEGEFDGYPIALPRDKRRTVMQSMKASGLSTRAIAAAVGVDQATVSRATTTKPKPADANASPRRDEQADDDVEPDPDARIIPRNPNPCFEGDGWEPVYAHIRKGIYSLLRNPTYAQAGKMRKTLANAQRQVDKIMADIEEAERSR